MTCIRGNAFLKMSVFQSHQMKQKLNKELDRIALKACSKIQPTKWWILKLNFSKITVVYPTVSWVNPIGDISHISCTSTDFLSCFVQPLSPLMLQFFFSCIKHNIPPNLFIDWLYLDYCHLIWCCYFKKQKFTFPPTVTTWWILKCMFESTDRPIRHPV